MKLKVTIEFDKRDLDGLIGGANISYWASDLKYHGGFKLWLRDEYTGVSYRLTKAKVLKGIRIMSKVTPHLIEGVLNGYGDANTGDALIQFALFGELVYG